MAQRGKKKRNKGSAGNNRKTGEDFLAQNVIKEGVTQTESGLQFVFVEETNAQKPTIYDAVKIHQRALLLEGKILEDTYRKNEPDEVKLEELIEGLQLMGVGSRSKFWLPPELAWGKKGTGNKIPPYAVLSFDIRLLEIIR